MEQVKKKADWRGIIFLQAIIVIYTFSSVCGDQWKRIYVQDVYYLYPA